MRRGSGVFQSKYQPVFLGLLLWLSIAPVSAQNSLERVNVSSLLDFNAILITEVDVIFVYDTALLAELPGNKSDWYRDKYDFLKQGAEKIEVVTVSAPQGFVSDVARLPDRHGEAVKVLVAAYHEQPDVPLHDITQYQRVRVDIDSFGILITGQ